MVCLGALEHRIQDPPSFPPSLFPSLPPFQAFIVQNYGFTKENIKTFTDEPGSGNELPTRVRRRRRKRISI
jgi:hypothetical protein